MRRNKKVRVYVHENKPNTSVRMPDGTCYMVDAKGCRRKVVVDEEGKIIGIPKKLTKKERIKIYLRNNPSAQYH